MNENIMKSFCQYLQKATVLAALLFFLLPQAKASHIVGGDISYQHIEGNTYEILVRVYRDCFYGAPTAQFDDPASVGVFNDANVLVDQLLIEQVTDDTLDAIFENPCLFVPEDVCVHTTEYRDTISLAPLSPGFSYTFVYQRCCRNQTITNIVDPDQTGASYTVKLTSEAMSLNNSTADFGQPAPIFICVGEEIAYDHSATEADGDELVYSFCLPKTGASFDTPRPQPPFAPPYPDVQLEEGFTLTNLLGGGPNPMTIDPQTGLISGIPVFTGQYVVGVCVQEFRDGELLSTVRRDFQYNVGQCLEVTSQVDVPDAQCEDLTVDFTNTSLQSDDFIWFFDYPNNLNAASTEISPTYTYPDTGTYTIRLISEPNIPCSDTLDFEIYLQNNSLTADFSFDTYDCGDRSFIVATDESDDFISPVVEWDWVLIYGDSTLTSDEQNPVFFVPPGSDGELTLTATSQNGCVRSTTQIFTTGDNDPFALFVENRTICAGESVELNPDFNPNLNFNYTWTPTETLQNPDTPNPTATPTETTTYTVIAVANEAAIDCELTRTVTVTVQPQPVLAFDFEVGCNDLTVQFNNQSENAAAVRWDFDDNGNTSTEYSPEYTFSDYGTYEIELAVADSELCLDTITQTITLMPLILDARFDFAYTGCSEEEITVQFTNTSENTLDNTESYTWIFSNVTSSSEENPTVVIEEEQILTATLTITTAQGCTASVTQDLNVDFTEIDLPTAPVQVCLGTETGLNPNGDPTYNYVWTPAAGLDDPNAVNPLASPAETTTYTVFIQNLTGADTCSIVREVTVTVPPAIGLTVSDDVVTCEDEAQILTDTEQAAVISIIANDFESTQPNVTVPVSGETVYTVTAADLNGCTETETVTISGGSVMIDAQGDAVICNDDGGLNVFVTNADPNDDLTYVWSPAADIVSGGNTANPTVTNEPGIYTFTVQATNQFDCTTEETVEAVIYDTDAEFAFDFEIECNGATVVFNNQSENAFSYEWDFGVADSDEDTSLEDNPSFTFPGPGVYQVTLGTVFDVDCVTPVTVPVEIPEELLIADFAFAYAECETDEITVSFTDQTQNFLNNTVAWEWVFSNNTTSNVQNPTVILTEEQELTATLTVTTADGCTATHENSFVIDFIEENVIDAVTICYGDATELNPGGTEDYEYNWTPATGLSDATVANPTANPLETTTYNLTITNTNAADVCIITREVTVTVTDQIALAAPADEVTCGEEVTLTATTQADDLTITWVDDNGDTYSGASIDVLPETALSYYVTAVNFFGCSETDTVTVTNGNMDLTTQGTRITCPVETLVIEAFNNDFSDVVDWQWEAGAGGTIVSGANNSDPTVSIQTEGVPVQFYVTATNQFNCSAQDSVTVIMSEFNPAFDAQVQICSDVPTELNPNANDQYVYEWSPAVGLSDPNVPNPTVTLTEDQTYTVTITDFQGIDTCFSIETVQVNVNPLIGLFAAGDTLLCAEETVNISAGSAEAAEYEWATDPDFSNIFATGAVVPVTPVGTETYYVRATDNLGCIEEDAVTISSFPLDFTVEGSRVLCFGERLTLNAENNADDQTVTYQWTPAENIISGADSPNPEVNPDTTTVFYLEITNQIGCTAVDSTQVIVEDVGFDLFASATPDTILFGSGETSQLLTVENPDYKYDWQPEFSLDDSEVFDPIASPEETTMYTVEVTGELGCVEERSVEVVVIDLECREPFVFIPNAFTPNGDGENDMLFVRGSNIDEVFLTVYNRWGEKMFETNDKNVGWDGRYKGEQLPPDVYGYYMQVKCFNGMEYFKKGNVSILR